MTVESVRPEAGPPATPELREPPLAGGGVPLLGHGWKLVRDPLAFMAYEYRKDILTYATILLVLTLVRGVETVRR